MHKAQGSMHGAMLFFVVLCVCFIKTAPASLNHSAFCSFAQQQQQFPLHLPQNSSKVPWVWDAVYDPVRNEVRIVTVTINSCHFDKNKWNMLVQSFPQYSTNSVITFMLVKLGKP